MIAVVDYGAGNVQSVVNALERIGAPATLTANPDDIAQASGIIVPGVGAARDTMRNLSEAELIEPIMNFIQRGRPYLGICMGMQALMTLSEEHGGQQCLNVIPGKARILEIDLQVPHMGWNGVNFSERALGHPLLDGIPSGAEFYFAHSFACYPDDPDWILATTDYGVHFPSILGRSSIMSVQFHPEKSGPNGLRLLSNFADLVAMTAQSQSGREAGVV